MVFLPLTNITPPLHVPLLRYPLPPLHLSCLCAKLLNPSALALCLSQYRHLVTSFPLALALSRDNKQYIVHSITWWWKKRERSLAGGTSCSRLEFVSAMRTLVFNLHTINTLALMCLQVTICKVLNRAKSTPCIALGIVSRSCHSIISLLPELPLD